MDELARQALLASAVAMRRIELRSAATDATDTFSDGTTIILQRGSVDWRTIVAQATLIAAGSFDGVELWRLVGRDEAGERYVYLEVMRASAVCRDRLPQRFTDLIAAADPPTQCAAASLAMALGKAPLPPKPAFFGTIKPIRVLARVGLDQGLAAFARAETTWLTGRGFRRHAHHEPTETSALLRILRNPLFRAGALADILSILLDAGAGRDKNADGAGAAGGEFATGRTAPGPRRGIHAVLAKVPTGLRAMEAAASLQALTYPEWNVHTKAYRPNFVHVEIGGPWTPTSVREPNQAIASPPAELRRQLSLLGLDSHPCRRQRDGADLDTPALIEHAIDSATGHGNAMLNIYRASHRNRRNLAVVIALDVSGSTGDARSPVFRNQIATAYQVGKTFNALGDRVAIFGFHSWGSKHVRIIELKRQQQPWSSSVADRFEMLEPAGYTRTGAAIRHGVKLLQTEIRLPHRLLILITDGIPYDQDYENGYATSDTARALQEAAEAGTACVCLSVDPATERQRFTDIFGAANILTVDDPAQITRRLGPVCRQALHRAAKARVSAYQAAATGTRGRASLTAPSPPTVSPHSVG